MGKLLKVVLEEHRRQYTLAVRPVFVQNEAFFARKLIFGIRHALQRESTSAVFGVVIDATFPCGA